MLQRVDGLEDLGAHARAVAEANQALLHGVVIAMEIVLLDILEQQSGESHQLHALLAFVGEQLLNLTAHRQQFVLPDGRRILFRIIIIFGFAVYERRFGMPRRVDGKVFHLIDFRGEFIADRLEKLSDDFAEFSCGDLQKIRALLSKLSHSTIRALT